MASLLPSFIKQFWRRDPWVQPENRVTRTVEVDASPEQAPHESPVIGAPEDSSQGQRPDEAA
jgi:hypothetical protein